MIVALVEGDCEMNVLSTLIQRDQREPLRCIDMKGKSHIVRIDGFEKTIRRQVALGGLSFIVLMDGDVTFAPYNSIDEEQRDMQRRVKALSQELGVPIRACWAVIETESWLIGGIRTGATYCGLKGVGQISLNTETTPQDPKRWLKDHLKDDYDPQAQRCLAQHIDISEAKKRNDSMQVFFDCFKQAGQPDKGSRRSPRRRR